MWIIQNNTWKNVTDEQFLAMSQKANGIEPVPVVDAEPEVKAEKPKVRKPRTKKVKA